MQTQREGDVATLQRENARRLTYFENHGGLINGICDDCLGPTLGYWPHVCQEDRRGGLQRVRREFAAWVKANR